MFSPELHETDLSTLVDEIFRRQQLQADGRCDYCGQLRASAPCKMGDRHALKEGTVPEDAAILGIHTPRRSRKPSFDLAAVREAHAAWQLQHFPAMTTDDAFLGIVEELGELSHSILKARHRIRGTVAEHAAKRRDAVGDIFIFLMSFARLEGHNIEDIIGDTWSRVATRDWTANSATGVVVGATALAPLPVPPIPAAAPSLDPYVAGKDGDAFGVVSRLTGAFIYRGFSATTVERLARIMNKPGGRYTIRDIPDSTLCELVDNNHKRAITTPIAREDCERVWAARLLDIVDEPMSPVDDIGEDNSASETPPTPPKDKQ